MTSQEITTSNPEATATRPDSRWGRLKQRLFEPVDIASIAIFRIMFGLILCWEVWRFFENDWIRLYYIVRNFYFKYFGFEWVHPWPGDGMYYHFLFVGFMALCVATGFLYRITSWLFFLGFTYWFLLDETRYLNHLYMVSLVALLMAIIPAHRARSFDIVLWPRLRSETIATWCLWLLRAQVAIVYFYAGIAKLNGDWLRGEPIRAWLYRRDEIPLLGPWLDNEFSVWVFAYGGLLFDLLVAPALLWRKTRPYAFAACVVFHLTNKFLFNIGIFPFMMLAATLLMFPPDWPRRVLLFFQPRPAATTGVATAGWTGHWRQRLVLTFLVAYLSWQVLMPFRHLLYPGSVHWTEEGHRFSWHMKLREKRANVQFFATDPRTGRTWEIDQTKYLSSQQRSHVGRWPDMCLQFAHFMAEELRKEGYPDIEIRAKGTASLNGRRYQPLIDPNVDLVKEKRVAWPPASWIVPLREPLPSR